jgi:hypothetical protein
MTRRMSQRARAQEIFREMTEAQGAATPTPDPSPQGGGEQGLTARARALYETSAVPVREIAALAGVTERTIYKYAQKGGWKARYAWVDRGGVAGRRRRANDAFAPAKGAGGRFIRREDSGQPFARGLKATDPHGATRAAAACARTQAAASEAQAEAEAARRHEERIRAIGAVNRALRNLADFRQARAKRLPLPGDNDIERALHSALDAAVWCLELSRSGARAATAAEADAARFGYLASIGKS